MVKGHGKELNTQRGSATIEAAVGFTAFLFAIFTILGLVNFCRAQMLVSAAVDTAAKEMSQYAYFYEMSGLQKFKEKLDNNASVGKNNINEIIGTVDTLYSSINGAVEQTVQEKTNVANMIAAGDADLQTFENAITGIENSAEGVMQGITGVGNALKDVGNDPLLYMRSLVALIGSEGMEAAKRAVAVPLARAFVSKHFGEDTDAANAKLKSLGIEGGLDSMNFNLSNIFSDIFSDDKHQDIEITVIYKVKLLQVFDWVALEADVSKVAVCRAWLGGDDVIVKAVSSEQPSLGTEAPTTDGENTDETTQNTDPTEETTDPAEETTEPNNTHVDTTNSYWHLGDGGYGVENAGVEDAFHKQFNDAYNVDPNNIGSQMNYVSGRNDKNETTTHAYKWDCKTSPDPDDFDMAFVMSEVYQAERAMKEGTLSEDTRVITYVLYVPENIPADDYEALETAASDALIEYRTFMALNQEGEQDKVVLSIDIVKAGGNYDYSSGGAE